MSVRYVGHGRDDIYIQVLLGNLKGGDHLGDLCIDGRIILKLDIVDYIHLAQDRDMFRTVVNTVPDLWVP
jgi:hypothetical protein